MAKPTLVRAAVAGPNAGHWVPRLLRACVAGKAPVARVDAVVGAPKVAEKYGIVDRFGSLRDALDVRSDLTGVVFSPPTHIRDDRIEIALPDCRLRQANDVVTALEAGKHVLLAPAAVTGESAIRLGQKAQRLRLVLAVGDDYLPHMVTLARLLAGRNGIGTIKHISATWWRSDQGDEMPLWHQLSILLAAAMPLLDRLLSPLERKLPKVEVARLASGLSVKLTFSRELLLDVVIADSPVAAPPPVLYVQGTAGIASIPLALGNAVRYLTTIHTPGRKTKVKLVPWPGTSELEEAVARQWFVAIRSQRKSVRPIDPWVRGQELLCHIDEAVRLSG